MSILGQKLFLIMLFSTSKNILSSECYSIVAKIGLEPLRQGIFYRPDSVFFTCSWNLASGRIFISIHFRGKLVGERGDVSIEKWANLEIEHEKRETTREIWISHLSGFIFEPNASQTFYLMWCALFFGS